MKIKEDTTVKKLLPDDWSYDGDNAHKVDNTSITFECIGNRNIYCICNAISILCSGYGELHCELHLKCNQEFTKNRYLYNTCNFHDYFSTDLYSFEKYILNWRNVATLSNVL